MADAYDLLEVIAVNNANRAHLSKRR